MTRIVALGDSFTSGEGIGVHTPAESVWTALLAAAIPGSTFESLGVPGARVNHVRYVQLPKVTHADIATVFVGLNDVARSGWNPAKVQRELIETVQLLSCVASTVVVGRLHDPVRIFRVPPPLRKLARTRCAIVNAAVDEAARLPYVHLLDFDQVTELHDKQSWAVDHVHPSLAGNVAMARAAADVLRAAGVHVGCIADAPQSLPSIAERVGWVAGHGLPYLARNAAVYGFPAMQGLLRKA